MKDYYTPNNLEDLYFSLKNMTEKSKIISGGTDLGIQLNKKMVTPDILVYMGKVEESKKVVLKDNFLEIGASLTHTEIQNCEIIRKYFPCITDACKEVGSLQIRNNGTIGGNIGNASPAGDLIPVMFMLNAIVTIASHNKELIDIPIRDFILGPGKTKLNYNEAILKFKIPINIDYISSFIKLGSRQKLTISRIGISLGITVNNGLIKKADIVIGAISLKPIILKEAQDYLLNKNINDNLEVLKERTASILSKTIMEITPEKFDRDYKAWASKGIIYDSFDLIKSRM